MRRTLAVLSLSVLLLMPLAGEALSVPGGFAEASQSADGDWLVKIDGKYFAYMVGASNVVGADGVGTFAFAAKGPCTVTKSKHFTMTMCVLMGRMKEIDASQFEFDPQLGSASVKWGENDVAWTGKGDLNPDFYEAGGIGFGFATAGLYRWAPATGKVLGRRMPKKMGREDFGGLSEGGTAVVFAPPVTKFTVNSSGRVQAQLKFRIPN